MPTTSRHPAPSYTVVLGGDLDGGADWRSRMIGRSVGAAADRALQRGQSIIAAAARVLHRSGDDDFTMQSVAVEAGVSMRTLYQHFAGKDDLFVALLEESQVVFARLLDMYAGAYSTPLDRLGAALYFATDQRQHTDAAFNTSRVRFAMQASLTTAGRVGAARRPVIEVLARLIDDAIREGDLEPGDPEILACEVNLAYLNFQAATYLGNLAGGRLPSNEQFIRFCLCGLGARLPPGWEERLRLSDAEAASHRDRSRRAAGTH